MQKFHFSQIHGKMGVPRLPPGKNVMFCTVLLCFLYCPQVHAKTFTFTKCREKSGKARYAAWLSQRPLSRCTTQICRKLVKMNFSHTFAVPKAGVVKLVDTPDLGSGAARLGGSSPSTRTLFLTSAGTRVIRVPAVFF